jgi:hypothetical protein
MTLLATLVALIVLATACGDSSDSSAVTDGGRQPADTSGSDSTGDVEPNTPSEPDAGLGSDSGGQGDLVAMVPATLDDCTEGPEAVVPTPAANPGSAYPLELTDEESRGCFLTSSFSCDQIGLVIGRAVVTDTFPLGEEAQDGYAPGEKVSADERLVVFDASMTNLGDGPDASSGECDMLHEVPNAIYWETIEGIPASAPEFVGAIAVNRVNVRLEDGQSWQGRVVLAIDAEAPSVEIQTGFGPNETFTHSYQIPAAP